MAKIKDILEKIEKENFLKLVKEAIDENERFEAYERQRKAMVGGWYVYENFHLNPYFATTGGVGHKKTASGFGGCLEFGYQGDNLRYLTVSASTDFNIGTNDFTVEWFQYQINGSSYPRIFQFGGWPSDFGVSVEGGEGGGVNFYFWNGSYISVEISDVFDKWVHFAVSRVSGITRIYKDGQLLIENSDNYSIDVTGIDMNIGIDPEYLTVTYFSGGLTNFRLVSGTGLYTGVSFEVPTFNLEKVNGTVLLLNVSDESGFLTDSSGTGKIVHNSGDSPVIWNSSNPIGGFVSKL